METYKVQQNQFETVIEELLDGLRKTKTVYPNSAKLPPKVEKDIDDKIEEVTLYKLFKYPQPTKEKANDIINTLLKKYMFGKD